MMKAYISKSDNGAQLDVSKIPKSAMRELARCALSAMQKEFADTKPSKKTIIQEQEA